MRLDDDFHDDYQDDYDDYYDSYKKKQNKTLLNTFWATVFVALLVVVCVISFNKDNKPANNNSNQHANENASDTSINDLLTGSTLRAEDLDFWDDYPDKSNYANNDSNAVSVDNLFESASENEVEEDDPSSDGRHTLITYKDGKEEWVEINPYVKLNDYDYNNLVFKSPFMKYYIANRNESYIGVDLSKTNEYVDFKAMKKAGVSFVMLRLGQRGYESGELSLDDNFIDNFTRAKEAGLDIGLYFYSQAVNKDEAVDEAEFVINTIEAELMPEDYLDRKKLKKALEDDSSLAANEEDSLSPFDYERLNYSVSEDSISDNSISDNLVSENSVSNNSASNNSVSANSPISDELKNELVSLSGVNYPICFVMDESNFDKSRASELSQMARTNIAMAFMDEIENYGFASMLYGNKEWLIKKYSIATLEGYDIWLDEVAEMPSYPYRFKMWKYAHDGKIDGISGDVDITISFEDYSVR